MKIAIAIAGHMRLFEKTHKSFFKNILGDHKADFFISTWPTIEGFCKCGSCKGKRQHLDDVDTTAKLDEIKSVYNPISINIENYSIKEHIKTLGTYKMLPHELNGFFGNDLVEYFTMLWSWTKVRDMIDNSYDIIIRLRPDILFESKLDLDYIDLNRLTIPNIATYYHNGINDQFALGNNHNMKVYLSMYDRVPEYISKRQTMPLRPETLLKLHINSNRVIINPVAMKYYILRTNGEILYPVGPNMHSSMDQKMIAHLV